MNEIEITLTESKSKLVLVPERGGIATHLVLGGRELFYLDESTLRDSMKNVRGGNPVLFPSPGKLENDAYAWKGTRGALKQHGFARNLAWEVAEKDASSVTLRLRSSDEIRREYPWNFVAEYTYKLGADSLRIEMTFTNEGDSPMPFGAGFHPYFAVSQADKAAARVETNATRAFDNVRKKTGALEESIDLTKSEVDLHLVDHTGACTLDTKTHAVRLRGSPEFSRWVVWTVAGKDFVCVEPWTSPGNALNTGDSLIVLDPGASRSMWVEYVLA